MDWLKTLAPALGTALAGPLGGAAAAFLADKLGVDTKTVEAVSKVLADGKLTPDQIVSIKAAEVDFQRFLETNKIKLEELASADRRDARAMMVSTKAKTPAILTWVVVVAVLSIEAWMLFGTVSSTLDPLIFGRILGTLDTALGLALAYWFGTTNSSSTKTDLLANSKPA